MVLGESTCGKWGESTKGKAWSGSKLGRAGDGARELLPWTACPGTQKNLDPEHPLARDSRGRRLALVLYPCLIQVVLCRVLALCASHPLPIPRGPSCPLARHECFLMSRREKEQSFSTRCTEPAHYPQRPAANSCIVGTSQPPAAPRSRQQSSSVSSLRTPYDTRGRVSSQSS